MTANIKDLPYRRGVGIALFNPQGLVFVGERIDMPGAWQMPQGGIDEGEDIEDAARRELMEEIGTSKIELIKIAKEKIYYDLPSGLQKKLWQGQFRGQEQTWIAARFIGDDSDINIKAHKPAEFQNWRWLEFDRTVDFIVPFKKKAYQEVIGFFKDLKI